MTAVERRLSATAKETISVQLEVVEAEGEQRRRRFGDIALAPDIPAPAASRSRSFRRA